MSARRQAAEHEPANGDALDPANVRVTCTSPSDLRVSLGRSGRLGNIRKFSVNPQDLLAANRDTSHEPALQADGRIDPFGTAPAPGRSWYGGICSSGGETTLETTCSHVLVVDDDVDMCHQLSDYLGRNDAAADSREVSLHASALLFIRIGDPTDDRFSALGTSSKTEVS